MPNIVSNPGAFFASLSANPNWAVQTVPPESPNATLAAEAPVRSNVASTASLASRAMAASWFGVNESAAPAFCSADAENRPTTKNKTARKIA